MTAVAPSGILGSVTDVDSEAHVRLTWPYGSRRWKVEFLNTPGEWWAWTRWGAKRLARRHAPWASRRSQNIVRGPRCESRDRVPGLPSLDYRCTLYDGHSGDHEATGTGDRLIEWWRA